MGLAAVSQDSQTDTFAALYPRRRDNCDLDGLERLGDPWANCEELRAGALQNLLRYLLSEASDAEDARRLVALHRFWGDAATLEAACQPLPAAARRRRAKLRIGLLSSDLRDHPVGRHVLPWLRHYDRGRFEIVAFSPDERAGDPVQGEIRAQIGGFEILGDCGLRETAERIRAADIDILLELNGHTVGTRLGALAYRAAPAQIEWLGYQFTSGLPAVDYFLMDDRLAPSAPGLLCETPLLVAESWVCYGGDEATDIAPAPMSRNGFVTFGTMGHPFKYTRRSFALWAGCLGAVPGARFLFVRPEAGDSGFRANVLTAFDREGIDRERIAFFDNRSAGVSHFAGYNEIDIALDTAPVAGGTTTGDALWMGVPVVSLTGAAPHQRLGSSLLAGAGLSSLCAESAEGYVRLAAALAADGEGLARLRRELRLRMRNRPLGDAPRFAQAFDAALVAAAQARGLA